MLRSFQYADFGVDRLVAAKRGRTVTVCLPARNEAGTVGGIVTVVREELVERRAVVDEVLVMDDGSTDGTAAVARAAGARVVAVGDVLPDYQDCVPGDNGSKGGAMWRSLHVARGDLIAWCDADVRNFGPGFVTGLLGPLLTTDDIGFVKGFYARPLGNQPGEGGRVTELVARPALSLLFPHLRDVRQPLAGECAGRREVLEQLPFVEGYGVDLALLIDVVARFGVQGIAQVDLGVREHRNRPLAELAPQAQAVLRVALARAGVDVALEGECPPLTEVAAYRRSA